MIAGAHPRIHARPAASLRESSPHQQREDELLRGEVWQSADNRRALTAFVVFVVFVFLRACSCPCCVVFLGSPVLYWVARVGVGETSAQSPMDTHFPALASAGKVIALASPLCWLCGIVRAAAVCRAPSCCCAVLGLPLALTASARRRSLGARSCPCHRSKASKAKGYRPRTLLMAAGRCRPSRICQSQGQQARRCHPRPAPPSPRTQTPRCLSLMDPNQRGNTLHPAHLSQPWCVRRLARPQRAIWLLHVYLAREHHFHAACAAQPATARAAPKDETLSGSEKPPLGQITPAQALRFYCHELSEYEQGEILEYKTVYCLVRAR